MSQFWTIVSSISAAIAAVAAVAALVPAYLALSDSSDPQPPPQERAAAPQPTTVSEPNVEPPSSGAEKTEIAKAPETGPALEIGPAREPTTTVPDLHRASEPEPESVTSAPTAPLQGAPPDGGSGPSEEASVMSPCVPVGSSIVVPIYVIAGTRLCSADSSEVAVIKRVTENLVLYSVNDKTVRCYVGDICGFAWRDGPLFRVRVEAADGKLTASLVSRD